MCVLLAVISYRNQDRPADTLLGADQPPGRLALRHIVNLRATESVPGEPRTSRWWIDHLLITVYY